MSITCVQICLFVFSLIVHLSSITYLQTCLFPSLYLRMYLYVVMDVNSYKMLRHGCEMQSFVLCHLLTS